MKEEISGDRAITSAVGEQLATDEQAGAGKQEVLWLSKVRLNPTNNRTIYFSKEWMESFRKRVRDATGLERFGSDDISWLDKGYELAVDAAAEADRLPAASNAAERAREQLEHVLELAHSISVHNLMQPVNVLSESDGYVVVAGDCRTLAHTFLGRRKIAANVRERSESPLRDRVASLVENLIRDDLSLAERLSGIQSVIEVYETETGEKINARKLHELIYESERTCRRYLNILRKSGQEILDGIWSGDLTSLREVEAAKREYTRPDDAERHVQPVGASEESSAGPVKTSTSRSGPKREKVHLGTTKDFQTVRVLVTRVVPAEILRDRIADPARIDWSDPETVQTAWNLAMEVASGEAGSGGDQEGDSDA